MMVGDDVRIRSLVRYPECVSSHENDTGMGGAVSTTASVDPPPKSPARFQRIPDTYETYEELQRALRAAGLESSSLIIGIDYTKSNTWTGEKTFRGKCLHDIDPSGRTVNPYQHVIEMMGRTLETFDDDKLIPVFGFGDASTGGSRCFPFLPDNHACHTFAQVLARYNQITPGINLAGPTNFAPIIREAIRICRQLRTYHILVIIADGHVNNQEDTVNAIVEASAYPISIVMVGVGDGPWDIMEHFDDFLPARRFDNFQFVEYHKMLKCNPRNPDVGFATAALMEVPAQYKLLREARLL